MKREKKKDGVLVMVYGTLKHGNKNAHLMREAYHYLGEGETVRKNLLLVNMTGCLWHWFPGAVELVRTTHKKAGSIKGEVYLIPYKLLRRLDAHEGCYLTLRGAVTLMGIIESASSSASMMAGRSSPRFTS